MPNTYLVEIEDLRAQIKVYFCFENEAPAFLKHNFDNDRPANGVRHRETT